MKQLMDAGVRVFFYLEDRERTLDNAMDKVMLSLAGFASEVERERCRQRTADALKRKAQLGHVTGGKVYGYDNVEVCSQELGDDGKPKRLHTVLEINEAQAEIIRHIYQLYVKGWGVSRIAKHLNTEHIPAPRKARAGWAPSAVWEILHRSKYCGVLIYNMYENVYRGGTIKRVKRPEEQWIVQEAPHLRIVSPELEKMVEARIAENA